MKLFVLILSFFCVSHTWANTYYISPTGSDATGTGTITNPWKTLYKATSTITTSGNTIFLLPGVYVENQTSILKPGVSLQAADTGAVLKSTMSAQFVPIVQMHSPEGTLGNQTINNIKFDGNNRLTSWAISIRGRSNVEMYGCVFRDFEETAIMWAGRNDGALAPPTIFATGNSFHDNIITNSATMDASYGRGAFQFGGQDGMQIYNNYISSDSRPAGLNGWPIKGCNDSWIKNCRLHHNTLVSAPYPYFTNGTNNYWDFSIELFDNLGGNIIDSNIVNGSIDMNRQHKGSAPYSVWIHHNTIGFEAIQFHRQCGIILEYSTEDAIIEYNTIRNTADGIMFSMRSGSAITNTTIRNNHIFNLGSTLGGYGTAIGTYDDGSANYTVNGMFVYNNTIKCAPLAANAAVYGVNFSNTSGINNWQVKNNILIGFQESTVWTNTYNLVSNSQCEYNYFYGNVRNVPFTNWQGTVSLPAGNTISNNTLGVNPILQGVGNIIGLGSPCIDAGVNVGTAYSGAAPDVGWFEYGSSVPNVAPTANAGPDQSITLPTNTTTLTGSGTDPDGTIVSYQWTKIAGPTAGTITTPAVATTTLTGLVQGSYQFELKVTDNGGDTGKDTVMITVLPDPNIPPTADAGPDQAITLPTNNVTLNGSGNDPDGTIVAYQWTKIAGPATGTITTPAAATTTVTSLSIVGTYSFELKVTDNNGASGKDTVQIIVNPSPANIAPTANAGPDQIITLPTNNTTLAGSGNDPDGTIISYQWAKIAGPAAGTITTPAAATTTLTGLVQGSYQFELTVTDNSGAVGKDTIIVTVNPDPNIAPTANAGPDQTITLPTNSVTLNGSGNDPDGTIVAYQWTKIAGPTAGTITTPAAATTTITGLAAGVYRFELRVTDNSGAVGRDTVQITVNPAPNIAPTANAGPDQTITLPTNSVTLNGSGNDPDGSIVAYQWTKIAGPAAGTITTPAAATTTVTGLAVGVYKFQLRVTDNSGAFGRDTVQITVNPAPNVPPTANAGADQLINLPVSSTSLNGSGNDPDGSIVAYQWTKIAGPAAGVITTPSSAATTLTGLVQGIYKFELRVTDNSGAFARDTVTVTVNIPPIANAGNDISITLPTTSTTLTGTASIDIDGSIIVYSWTKISGPNAGVISTPANASTALTGLIAGIYKYELTVTDNYNVTDKDTVQVIVFAPNIPPAAHAGLDLSLTLPTNSVTLSGSGTDVDGTIVGYLWTKISGPAAGIITSITNATTSVTGLTAGVYHFELRVTDNNGGTGRDTVQVTVNPENIPPVANAGIDQSIILPINTATLSGRGTDVDGTVVSYRWRQIAGPADKLTAPNSPVSVLLDLIDGNYKFELTVTDNKGAIGKDTVAVTVKPMIITTQPNSIKIYPNPVTDFATLEINKDNSGKKMLIVITDVNGKIVYQKQIAPTAIVSKETINFSNFARGTYFVSVDFAAGDKQTVKAIKQ